MALKWNYIAGTSVTALTLVSGNTRIQTFTIAASADNVMPTNAAYVAISGSDTYGNGSRLMPFRTIGKAHTTLGSGLKGMILGDGVYYESGFSTTDRVYIGNSKDNVILDMSGLSSFGTNTAERVSVYNIKFINSKDTLFLSRGAMLLYDCTFKNVVNVRGTLQSNPGVMLVVGCKFINSNVLMYRSFVDGQFPSRNNSFYGCTVNYKYNLVNTGLNRDYDNVFKACSIRIDAANYASPESWVIDPDCQFAFSTAGAFSSYPDLASLKAAFIAAYPAQVNNFTNCVFANPLYNNIDKGDLTISKLSPARKLNTTGSLAGAENPAVNWNVVSESVRTINFESFDNELVVTDSTIDATLTLRAKDLGSIFELHNFPIVAEVIGRRGQSLTDKASFSSTIINEGTDVLTLDRAYLVINDSITWNSLILPSNSRFVATAGQLSFAGPGAVREIIHVPARRTCLMRVKTSIPATYIAAGASSLTIGNDYLVTGTVTHNGVTYSDGGSFRAVNTAFTGTGTVRLVFSSSDPYHSFQVNDGKVLCNRVGNVSTGDILRGNGDFDFDATTTNTFPVFARFVQPEIIIKSGNLI